MRIVDVGGLFAIALGSFGLGIFMHANYGLSAVRAEWFHFAVAGLTVVGGFCLNLSRRKW